jgi:hypothetical protein
MPGVAGVGYPGLVEYLVHSVNEVARIGVILGGFGVAGAWRESF